MRMVLGHGRRLTLVGIAFGIAGALVVSRLMQQALFEVDPAEPLVYIALSITLLLVAEAASFFPARSATRIDPVIALRTDLNRPTPDRPGLTSLDAATALADLAAVFASAFVAEESKDDSMAM